jgi:hypothetical protein
MAGYLFFRTSRSAYRQVTELFDFVTPTAAALWNLRWQVVGFCSHYSGASVQVLDDRFVSGSGLHGANLRRACIDTSWEYQQQQFAKFVLISLFSIYESWLADVLQIVAPAARHRDLDKRCQFPDSTARSGKGVTTAIAEIKLNSSPMTVGAFYAALQKQKKNALPKIQELLKCYRAFKESRNSFAHQNGLATQVAVDAYQAYAVLSALDLALPEKPVLLPVSLNKPIALSLRGVIGFSDVILRIIATLDAEFSCSHLAERELREQWVEKYSVNGKVPRVILRSAGVGRREKQLARMVQMLELPRPSRTSITLIDSFLKQSGFVF